LFEEVGMQPVEAQMVRGRLITGPITPLQRMRTLVGGWGLPMASGTSAQATLAPPKPLVPSPAVFPSTEIDVDIDVDLEENHFVPPRLHAHKETTRFEDAWPPSQLLNLRKQPTWRDMLLSRTAFVAGLAGAFVAGMMMFRHGVGHGGEPIAAPAPTASASAAPSTPVPASAAVAPPSPVAPPPPASAAPANAPAAEEPAPPAAMAETPVEEPAADTAPVAAAAATHKPAADSHARPAAPARPPRAQRQGKFPTSAQAPQHPKGWTDPFGDGSWMDLPPKH
jgi:hypothetical protein